MRIAMISDMPENSIAFDAVLDDIRSQGGIDSYWILGDHFNQGYDPVGVMDRISKLPSPRCVSGNTDRYAIVGGRRGPSFERVIKDPRLLNALVSVEQGNGWARGAISATGWFKWLKDLPFEQRMTLPDGTRLLGVHASLASDELVVVEDTTAKEAEKMFPDCQADVVFAGHAHLEPAQRLPRTLHGPQLCLPRTLLVRAMNTWSPRALDGSCWWKLYFLCGPCTPGARASACREHSIFLKVVKVVDSVQSAVEFGSPREDVMSRADTRALC